MRKALVVWFAATLVYVVAITGRTSMGVAGVAAIDHFRIDAARLAVFTSVQVGVYALAQIPTGMAIDRFKPRRMLVVGAIIMAIGQIMLGATSSYPMAVFARVLVGAGDASAFLSVMRLLPNWFPLRRTPLMTQLTTSLGQMGQFLSAVPFLAVLEHQGWSPAFIGLGISGIVVAFACAVAVHDSPTTQTTTQTTNQTTNQTPKQHHPTSAVATPPLRQRLRQVLASSACWEAFFTHWTGLMPNIVFGMLWGIPLMTLGQQIPSHKAAGVLVIGTAITVVISPVHGLLSARVGRRRSLYTLGFSAVYFVALGWFFATSTPRGLLAITAVASLSFLFAPSANFGFDSVREAVPRTILATGTGLANMGGFIATMLAGQAMGMILGSTYTWLSFRRAWIAVIVVWAVGAAGLFFARHRQLRHSYI